MPARQGTTSNIEFLQALNKYIPSLVLTHLVEQSALTGTEQLPKLQEMCTVTLFADISGFTNVSEACAKRGVRGNEELSFVINRYMEGMVKNFGKYGGDIIKFVGDAMIVMWPEDKQAPGYVDTETAQYERAKLTVRKAIQCALDIQNEMNNFQVISDVSSLSVKIGIGYGKCSLLYVGGVFGRAEFFTVGSALTYALKSEGECTQGGQTMVSDTAFRFVRDLYQAAEQTSKLNEKFFLVESLIGAGVKTRSDAHVLRSGISSETYNKIAASLRGCVPAAILPYLQIGAQDFGSETRSLTVMFASLGVDLSSAETKEGMEKIQKIVTCVQQQVYRHQGSVNKLVMDDKGSTLICLWGLTPMAHDDDASRAILTAIAMNNELMKIDNTLCKVGISSGEMFTGIVGTSGGRKEFSVLGDVANLAARIMGGGKYGQINCDMNTRNLASTHFQFTYRGHSDFKGKSISIPTFAPVWPHDELAEITKKTMEPFIFLKPWANPMIIERSTNIGKNQQLRMIGSIQEQAIDDLTNEIIDYFQTTALQRDQRPYMASIKGEQGSGKTLFARCLIDSLIDSEEFTDIMGKSAIFCSSLNSETQYKFLNIWQPILVQMMTSFCKREKLSREQAIQVILGQDTDFYKFINCLCMLFQADAELAHKLIEPGADVKQCEFNMRTHPFVMRETYMDFNRKMIYSLVIDFICMFVAETDPAVDQSSSFQKRLGDSKEIHSNPCLVFLDNTHLMDASSWELFRLIRDECSRIGIVLLQLSDLDQLTINIDAQQMFDQVWQAEEMTTLRQIEMPPLDIQTFQILLKTLSMSYKDTYYDEIVKMTEFVEGRPKVDGCKKTKETGVEWTRVLKEKWQVEKPFIEVDPQIIDVILKKCAGNPLLSLNYFVSLMQNGYAKMDASSTVNPTYKFQECDKMRDFINVPVPRVALRNNCSAIDNYIKDIESKKNKRPGELDNCIRSVVMLKVATILGEEFDTRSLFAVCPIKVESVSNINKLMKLLESYNLIEILDETDKENFLCRFNKPFLRESLYQIVLYRDQKNTMHSAAAQYFLNNPDSTVSISIKDTLEVQAEIRSKVIRQHMLTAQDIENENELSYEARTGLTVNRILNLTASNPLAIIKKEMLTKQGKGANKKASHRLVVVDSRNFRWYHNETEMKSGKFLGSVPIQFIYQTVASQMEKGNEAAFSISTSQWVKKQGQNCEMRDFFFACPSTYEMEDWIITLEFLRTKAVYDAYAQKNIPVQFPLRQGVQKTRQEERKDNNTLLYDFGGQLKQRTQMQYSLNQSMNNTRSNPKANVTVQTIPEAQLKEAVQKLKLLYSAGIVGLSHHLSQTAAKITIKSQNAYLGQLPEQTSFKLMENLGQFFYEPSAISSQKSDISGNQRSQQPKHRQVVADRRVSSISADVLKVQEQERAKLKITSTRVHTEIAGDHAYQRVQEGMNVPHQARRSEQVQIGELSLHRPHLQPSQGSNFLKNSESSPSTTPPQSVAQNVNVSNIIQNQTMTVSATQKELLEEQINAIENKPVPTRKPISGELVALYNHDERLDHLRSLSPPGHYHQDQRVMSTNDKPQTALSDYKSPAPASKVDQVQIQGTTKFKEEPTNNFISQSQQLPDDPQISTEMMQSLQQQIQDAINQGVSKLVQQNKQIMSSQSQQLSQIFIQKNQQMMSQSQLDRSGLSLETPTRQDRGDSLRQAQSMQDLSPIKNFMLDQHAVAKAGGGITSKYNRKEKSGQGHQVESKKPHEDDDLEDPLSSDDDDDGRKHHAARVNLVSPAVPGNQNVPSATTYKVDFSQQMKSQKVQMMNAQSYSRGVAATKSSTPALVNFKDERLYYPPPERWVDNEFAIYEEASHGNKVMDLADDESSVKTKQPQLAVCIRDTHCQRRPQFKLTEGSQVTIRQEHPQLKMVTIQYKNQQGLFKMMDFSKIYQGKPAQDKNNSALDLNRPILRAENFFKEVPERQLQQNMDTMSPEEIAQLSKRILDDEKMALKQQNKQILEMNQRKTVKRSTTRDE